MNESRELPDVFECENAEAWNLLLEDSPFASAYLAWEYGEALCKTYGYKKHYLMCRDGSKNTGALPLIHVKSVLFGNRLISLPFCEFGGPTLRSDLKQEETAVTLKHLLKRGIDLAVKLRVDYIELRHPSISNESIFANYGFDKLQSYVSFCIELAKGTKQLWVSLDKKTRNAVRKAQKSGLQVEDVTEPSHLKEYYSLYLQTQKRLGSPPHSFTLFENLFSALSSNRKMQMIIVRHDGVAIAGITVFLNGTNVFWWNNVSNIEHRSLNPTNLLLWNTIEWATQNGYKTMDMGRTRKPSSIYNFKSGWGGEEKPLEDYIRFLDAKKKNLPDPSQLKYKILSDAWSLLPAFVSRRIGSRIVKGIAL